MVLVTTNECHGAGMHKAVACSLMGDDCASDV
jgi:hypothetical protein